MKVLIAGDYCPHNRVAGLFERDDYTSVLSDVKNVIEGADYSIVNLECPVTKGGERPITKYGPNLQCSKKGVEALKWCGFKCVTLANNHFLDFGGDGVSNTLKICQEYRMDVVGGGNNLQEASVTLYKKIGGRTVAIINCCEHEFSIASETSAGSNPLNPIKQYYSIKEAKQKADYIIVIVHGGHELFNLPSLRMQETYRFFIDAGADAVVNHHQHYFSGYEVYKNRPIFYGLGNFCSDSKYKRDHKWYEGYMVLLDLDTDISFEIIPYDQCKDQVRIRLLGRTSFSEEINRINAIITSQKDLKKAVDDYYASCSQRYGDIFEPFTSKYYLACKARNWLPSFISKKRQLLASNYICCESHRDILTYCLSKI